MSQLPPPPPSAQPPVPGAPAPQPATADRIRLAYQRRNETDYVFNFWTAFGWSLLTCGIYMIYVIYRLVGRSRDHNARRLEELDAATTFAWEQATAEGVTEELRPAFERVAEHLAVLRQMTGDFRDPAIWALLAFVARGITEIVAFVLLDQDLVKHDYREGGAEHELGAIFTRLGAPLPPPDPNQLHRANNYVGRILATLATCGIYGLWWLANVMNDLNDHFARNWAWEDSLAQAVQQLA